MFKVLNGGFMTTVQDANGRLGFYSMGIPPSGALDSFALRVGNMILKNEQNAAALEVILFGPKLQALKDVIIAVTGGDFGLKIDNSEIPMWEAVRVRKGQVLTFGQPRKGATAYLCVAGGFDVPIVLKSRATYLRGRFGGYDGRKLQAGDVLRCRSRNVPEHDVEGSRLKRHLVPTYEREAELRFVLGVTDYVYDEASRELFFKSTWKVSSESDRVGYRFVGPKLSFIEREPPFGAGTDPSNVVDTPYPIGSIHCPSGVVPILLHRDGVSGGGYATLGTVISADLDRVAQLRPGNSCQFRKISAEDGVSIRAEKERILSNDNIVEG